MGDMFHFENWKRKNNAACAHGPFGFAAQLRMYRKWTRKVRKAYRTWDKFVVVNQETRVGMLQKWITEYDDPGVKNATITFKKAAQVMNDYLKYDSRVDKIVALCDAADNHVHAVMFDGKDLYFHEMDPYNLNEPHKPTPFTMRLARELGTYHIKYVQEPMGSGVDGQCFTFAAQYVARIFLAELFHDIPHTGTYSMFLDPYGVWTCDEVTEGAVEEDGIAWLDDDCIVIED